MAKTRTSARTSARNSARGQMNVTNEANLRILSFNDPKDVSLMLLLLGLAFLLRHFVHKSVRPNGLLRKIIKEQATTVQEKRSKKILAMVQDPFLAADLERRLEFTLGDKNLAKAEIRKLKEASENILNTIEDEGSSEGGDVGTTFAKILVVKVYLIYFLFNVSIWIFLPIFFSVVCSPLFLFLLALLTSYDASQLGKKYGLKGRSLNDVFQKIYTFFRGSQYENSELQESLLEKEEGNTSEVVPTTEQTITNEV